MRKTIGYTALAAALIAGPTALGFAQGGGSGGGGGGAARVARPAGRDSTTH